MKKILSSLSVAKPFPLDGNIEPLLPSPETNEAQDVESPKKGWHVLRHHKKQKRKN